MDKGFTTGPMKIPKWSEGAIDEDWGSINIYFRKPWWMATIAISHIDERGREGYLKFAVEGADPDEARARLEQAIVETLAIGGQLNERRLGPGRRRYDPAHTWLSPQADNARLRLLDRRFPLLLESKLVLNNPPTSDPV